MSNLRKRHGSESEINYYKEEERGLLENYKDKDREEMTRNSGNSSITSKEGQTQNWLKRFKHRSSEDFNPLLTISNKPPFDFAFFRAGFSSIKFNFLNLTKQKLKSHFFMQKVYNINISDLLGKEYLIKSKYVDLKNFYDLIKSIFLLLK